MPEKIQSHSPIRFASISPQTLQAAVVFGQHELRIIELPSGIRTGVYHSKNVIQGRPTWDPEGDRVFIFTQDGQGKVISSKGVEYCSIDLDFVPTSMSFLKDHSLLFWHENGTCLRSCAK